MVTDIQNVGRFYRQEYNVFYVGVTKSADFCMTDDIFFFADFIGRQNRPTSSIVWHSV